MFPIVQLLEEHAQLVEKLHRFSYPVAAELVASLALVPSLQANTIRIEVLEHLLAVGCQGRVKPDYKNLVEWMSKFMQFSPVISKEDPPEDVFVGCINSEFGSFCVLTGLYGDGDYWIERLLALLAGKQNFPPYKDAITSVLPLLRLSDNLLRRAGLARYSAGSGKIGSNIQIPRWRDLIAKTQALRYNLDQMREICASFADLSPFTLNEERRLRISQEHLWQSSLERFPLLESDGGILVISPTGIVRAVIRVLMEKINEFPLGWLDTFYQIENATLFVNEVASGLAINPLQFEPPTWPDALPSLFPRFGIFDFGKPVIQLTYCPELSVMGSNLTEFESLTEDQADQLNNYLESCMNKLENLTGFSGGMVLVALAGIGRPGSFSLRKPNSKWRMYAAPLPDWITIVGHDNCSAMRLWKMGDQRAFLEAHGVRLLDLGGLLNLFAFWKRNDFRLIPKQMDFRTTSMLAVDFDSAVYLRSEVKLRDDIHCVRSHADDRWVRLTRHDSLSLFEEDKLNYIYVDLDAVQGSQLVACVETEATLWWIVTPAIINDVRHRNLVLQLWECVVGWGARLAKVVEADSGIPLRSVEIKLELPNLENWKISNAAISQEPLTELKVDIDVPRASIVLVMPEGFMGHFNQEKNVAEQKIISAILTALFKLIGEDVEEQRIDIMLWKIIRNEDARFFHIVSIKGIEHAHAEPGRPRPLFVAEEDVALAEIGLADLVGRPEENSEFVSKKECSNFLRDTVTKVWERIEARLRSFERVSVVNACFNALSEISRDEQHWNMTARSVFALHINEADVHGTIDERRAERAKVTLCNRLIIETAQYACQDTGILFTQADHLTLLGEFSVLLQVAHHRDAVAFGFMEPKIKVSPNGEIEVDEQFYVQILSRYLTERSRAITADVVASYKDYFSAQNEEAGSSIQTKPETVIKFERAFASEYGFGLELVLEFENKLQDAALSTNSPGGAVTDDDIRRILSLSGFSIAQAALFLDRFALPIRTGWNFELPPKCREKDVFPWRYRRLLSLLARPIVQVKSKPPVWYVDVPFLRKALEYWIENIYRGLLPDEYFQASEMRKYIGDVVNTRGHAFARKVEECFISLQFSTRPEVELHTLGAPKNAGLGDIDVLAWDATGRIFVVECKRLLTALTVREVIQRVEDFRGNRKEKDSLGRHLRRIDWLSTNLSVLATYTGVAVANIRLIPLLVTSEIVPMQFFEEMQFPTKQVIPYDDLDAKIPNWR